ncbi:hypothetical protein FKM82_012648 [Ascaphus truei]
MLMSCTNLNVFSYCFPIETYLHRAPGIRTGVKQYRQNKKRQGQTPDRNRNHNSKKKTDPQGGQRRETMLPTRGTQIHKHTNIKTMRPRQ